MTRFFKSSEKVARNIDKLFFLSETDFFSETINQVIKLHQRHLKYVANCNTKRIQLKRDLWTNKNQNQLSF